MTAPYLAEMQETMERLRIAAALIDELPWWVRFFGHRARLSMVSKSYRGVADSIQRWATKARAAEVALVRLADDAREEMLIAEREARWRNKRAKVVHLAAHRERGPEPLDPRPAA